MNLAHKHTDPIMPTAEECYPTICLHGEAAEQFLAEHRMMFGDEFTAKVTVRVAGMTDLYEKCVTLEVKELDGIHGRKKGEKATMRDEFSQLQSDSESYSKHGSYGSEGPPSQAQGILGEQGEQQQGEGAGEIQEGE